MAIDFSKVKIFVEGVGDQVFIRDILFKLYNVKFDEKQLKETIVDCDGYNNLKSRIRELSETNINEKREDGKNLVIFDADFTGREPDHGFKNKVAYLDNIKIQNGVKFELFLFPNQESDGTLETILESCIPSKNHNIIDCWTQLEDCVKTEKLTIPANKSKIYFYLECLYGASSGDKKKRSDRNRNFLENDKWELDFEKNQNLVELKKFLNKHLIFQNPLL